VSRDQHRPQSDASSDDSVGLDPCPAAQPDVVDPYAPVGADDLLVLQLLARGYSAAQASTLCHRSEREVNEAAARAADCLGVRDTREAIQIALSCHLIV